MERKKTSLMIIGICALVLSIIGVSYAFWELRLSQKESDTISSSCFDVSLINEGKAIQLEKAYPVEDGEGEHLTPYTFTIKNNCEANAKYQINLESLTKLNSGEEVTERLDEKYLKVKLNEEGKEGSIQKLTDENKVEATLIEGQTEGKARSDKAYKLTIGYLEPKEEKKYELRLWLDGDVSTDDVEAMNKTYASKITVTATYSKEAYKTLVDTILAIEPKKDGSGETGYYKITHDNANITYTTDPFYIERLRQPELRFAIGDDVPEEDLPNLYVSFEDFSTKDGYGIVQSMDAGIMLTLDQIESFKKYLELDSRMTYKISYESQKNEENLYVATYTEVLEIGESYEVSMNETFQSLEECNAFVEESKADGMEVTECTIPDSFYVVTAATPPTCVYDTEEECLEELGQSYEDNRSCQKISKGDILYNLNTIWLIIGLVNTPEGQRIKLMSTSMVDIDASWDTSASNVNNGNGVNEWSQSDLMKLLNPGYENNELEDENGKKQPGQYVNNSLYWNGGKGNCYRGPNNAYESCDFNMIKIPESLKYMIDEVTWNLGSNGDMDYSTMTVDDFYEKERSNITGKMCEQSDASCNDTVERKTTWKGKVGLEYPSDLGYRKTPKDQDICRNSIYKNPDETDCDTVGGITITPMSSASDIHQFISEYEYEFEGQRKDTVASHASSMNPVVYLKPDALVKSGDGSVYNPYRLTME